MPNPTRISTLDELLRNFVKRYANPVIAAEGGWMEYQQRAAVAGLRTILLRNCEVNTWLFCRQSGKTEAFSIMVSAAALAIQLCSLSERACIEGIPFGDEMRTAFPDGLRAGIFAPKGFSASRDFERIQSIMDRVVAEFHWQHKVNNTQTVRVITTEGTRERQIFRMELHSAAPGANVESATFDVVGLEEAQDVGATMTLSKIDPMRAATRGSRWSIGLVGEKVCNFDREIDFNKAYHPERHFEVPYEIPVDMGYQHGAYSAFVEAEIARIGENSPSFRRNFRLLRDYETGMLLTEVAHIKLARIFEPRWPDGQPGEAPEQVYIVAGLDVARTRDFTVLKIGTADWRQVDPGDAYKHPWPDKVVRWQRTYPHADYDRQWEMIRADLARFPDLKKFGCIAIDATGDRGNLAAYLEAEGYFVIRYVFKGGLRETEIGDHGEIVPGSKHHLCQQYEDALTTGHFGYAADEEYMGSPDYFRAQGGRMPAGHRMIEPSSEYRDHKHQTTHAFRVQRGNSVVFCADPNDDDEHDDQIDADMLFTLAANYHQPVRIDTLGTAGIRRTMAGQGESFRRSVESFRTKPQF